MNQLETSTRRTTPQATMWTLLQWLCVIFILGAVFFNMFPAHTMPGWYQGAHEAYGHLGEWLTIQMHSWLKK